MIHYVKIENSPRLQAMLTVLEKTGARTTLDLQHLTGSMAVHTDIAELRANGYAIRRDYIGRTAAGRQIHKYTLLGRMEKP